MVASGIQTSSIIISTLYSLSRPTLPWTLKLTTESFRSAEEKQVDNLVRRKIWDRILKKEIPNDANCVDGHFVLILKNYGTSEEAKKH